MGGRGGSSGLSNNQSLRSFLDSGTKIHKLAQDLDMRAIDKTLSGVKDVFQDMGIPLSHIEYIHTYDGKDGGIAATDAFKSIYFSDKYSDYKKADEASANKNGSLAASGLYSVGAHEAGHLIVREIIEKQMAGKNFKEKTIAEAVSDVYTNKSRANPYSKVIVDIMKKKLKGK